MGTADNVNAWSSTASSNASSDSTISSSDSQSPDTLDNNIRDVMAAVRNWQKDIGGFATAGGSANAHTVTSASVISASHLTDGYRITYYAPATNTSATVTCAVDGLTATGIKCVDGSALRVGSIVNDQVLDLVYEAGAGVFRAVNIPAASGPASPGLVLLTSGTVAAATLDLVLTTYTGYRGLKFVLSGVLPVTDNVQLLMRFSTDGGSTYDASGYDFASQAINASAASSINSSTSTTSINLTNGGISNVATQGTNLTIEMFNQTSTAFWSRVIWSGHYVKGTAGVTNFISGVGTRQAAQDTDAVRFLMSSGNISAGNYAVYGYV